jgi:hypothetical protein
MCLAAMWCVPAGASAQSAPPVDYDPESGAWNGLSELVALAGESEARLEVSSSLDYDALGPDDRLFIVYPEESLDVDSLASFVIDGGRVLVADDFGASGSLLDRLDIDRVTSGVQGLPQDSFARDNPALPVFSPTGVHPLLEGVGTVIANHPAVLQHTGGPVVPYSKGGGLVYDMNLGQGKVIVVADSSLFINRMLQAGDNRRFAQNALGYLCRETSKGCSIRLLVGRFSQTGTYRTEEEQSQNPLAKQISDINAWIERMQDAIPSTPLLYYLAVLLAAGMGVYLTAALSLIEPKAYSEYIDEAIEDVPGPQSEFEWNLARFEDGGRDTNYALPLSILKEIFEELFLREMDAWDRKERVSIPALAERFEQQYLAERPPRERKRLREEVEEVLGAFARIPTRHRVFLESDAYYSERDLIKLYGRARRILSLMGLEEEYERRTRTLA